MTQLAVKYHNEQPYLFADREVNGMHQYKDTNVHYLPMNLYNRTMVESVTGQTIPLLSDYPWPSPPHIKPYKHQRITAEFLANNMRCWCLNGMRSGKSLSTAWALDFLFRSKTIERVLITAPLTILEDVWKFELFNVMPQTKVYIANESVDDFIHAMKYGDYDIIVCNHDKIKYATNTIDRWDPNMIVVDEAGGFRYWNTDRTKALTKLLRPIHRGLWALTATPVAQGPTDVWALARIIAPERVDKSFKRFEDRVISRCQFSRRVTVRPQADDIVKQALHPAIRYATEDCIDLPPQGYVTRKCPLTKEQDKAIGELRRAAVSIIKDIESGEDTKVVAANGAVVAGKIIQTLGGVVLDNNGEPRKVGADKRISELVSIINEAGGKVIVMCTFTAIMSYIQKQLGKKKIGSVILNGKTNSSAAARTEVLDKFRTDDNTQVLILHPSVGKYGLNLSIANTSVWYLPTWRSEDFMQANARMQSARTDTKQKTTVVKISSGPFEDRLYQRLTDKETAQANIIDVFRSIV